MGTLSNDLEDMGYERTEKESPFEDGGVLWTNGVELVCDETGFVIRNGDDASKEMEGKKRQYFRYPNSGRVRMIGGFFGSYDWGYDEDAGRFHY